MGDASLPVERLPPHRNASPPVERQRYSAGKRPEGKRTPEMGDATLPVERQPSPQTLVFPSNASLPVKRQRYSASKRPEGKRTPQV